MSASDINTSCVVPVLLLFSSTVIAFRFLEMGTSSLEAYSCSSSLIDDIHLPNADISVLYAIVHTKQMTRIPITTSLPLPESSHRWGMNHSEMEGIERVAVVDVLSIKEEGSICI